MKNEKKQINSAKDLRVYKKAYALAGERKADDMGHSCEILPAAGIPQGSFHGVKRLAGNAGLFMVPVLPWQVSGRQWHSTIRRPSQPLWQGNDVTADQFAH